MNVFSVSLAKDVSGGEIRAQRRRIRLYPIAFLYGCSQILLNFRVHQTDRFLEYAIVFHEFPRRENISSWIWLLRFKLLQSKEKEYMNVF